MRNIIHQNIAEYKHFCTKFSDRKNRYCFYRLSRIAV